MNASELVLALQKGEITSEQALLYYAHMACECHSKYNCLTHMLFPEALKRAQELDLIFKEKGPVGPIHGLPVSIKESISVKGTSNTAGMRGLLNELATDDAVVVKLLREAGAVIFVKSNVPQTLMISETSNSIYGTTTNPYNTLRTCGGSSGGEAVLIACGGSPFGVGTDIGGSLRIPAAWCGVFGMKPTSGRFSKNKTSPNLFPGHEVILSTIGPIVKSVNDASLFYKIVGSPISHELDPTVPYIPWNKESYESKTPLTIGFYTDDKYFTPSISSQRAVKMAVEKLQELGHNVVEFHPNDLTSLANCYFTFATGDGAPYLLKAIENESIDPSISKMVQILKTPKIFLWPLWTIFKLLGWNRMAGILPVFSGSAAYEHDCIQTRTDYRSNLIKMLKENHIDALVVPGPAIPPPFLNNSQNFTPALQATFVWNTLNFPASVVPVTIVSDEDLQVKRKVNDMVDYFASKNEKDSQGLPVSVQIVSFPFDDEVVLRLSKELQDSLNLKKD